MKSLSKQTLAIASCSVVVVALTIFVVVKKSRSVLNSVVTRAEAVYESSSIVQLNRGPQSSTKESDVNFLRKQQVIFLSDPVIQEAGAIAPDYLGSEELRRCIRIEIIEERKLVRIIARSHDPGRVRDMVDFLNDSYIQVRRKQETKEGDFSFSPLRIISRPERPKKPVGYSDDLYW